MKRWSQTALALLGIIALALAAQAALTALHVRFSSAVLGIIVLLVALYVIGYVSRPLASASDALLRYFPLFFVPPSVGAMQYGRLLAHSWIGLAFALVLSTLLGLWVAAMVGRLIAQRESTAR